MKKIILILFFLPIYSYANFIALNNGARSLSMGNAFVALGNEPATIFSNPAGLAKINSFYFSGSHQNLYGISDLYNDMLAISFPTSIFRTGIGIQQVKLLDAYSEQIIYFSAASIIRIKNIPFRFGGSLKLESANVINYEEAKNPSNFDFDFGILVDFSDNFFFGYSMKYLLEPKFKFISKTDQLKRQMTTGICYNWRNSVNFLADYSWSENKSKWNFGSEIWFYDIFAARLGMHDEKLTSGFGLKTNYWIFDVAVMAHQKLGSTYLISIGLLLGKKS